MIVSRFCCLSVLLAASMLCDAFQPQIEGFTKKATFRQSCSRLAVASGLITEEDRDCSISARTGPASVFGREIDEAARERNRYLIKNCKSVLFDTLFHGSELSRSYARFYALENIARMP